MLRVISTIGSLPPRVSQKSNREDNHGERDQGNKAKRRSGFEFRVTGFAKLVSRNSTLPASMDAKTIKYIERHPELDNAVSQMIRLWQEVEQGEEYGKTGVVLEHKAGRFDGTLHLLKDWTVKETL